ncbi:hypothetical protein DL93DRAFT_138546 [Clavulina sp. PMI_390]|nr:hypothetical protein DL93DRAFT_138546 [Clavulina sp. PMI_390]
MIRQLLSVAVRALFNFTQGYQASDATTREHVLPGLTEEEGARQSLVAGSTTGNASANTASEHSMSLHDRTQDQHASSAKANGKDEAVATQMRRECLTEFSDTSQGEGAHDLSGIERSAQEEAREVYVGADGSPRAEVFNVSTSSETLSQGVRPSAATQHRADALVGSETPRFSGGNGSATSVVSLNESPQAPIASLGSNAGGSEPELTTGMRGKKRLRRPHMYNTISMVALVTDLVRLDRHGDRCPVKALHSASKGRCIR